MRKIYFLFTILFAFLLHSCIIYTTARYEIEFDQEFKTGIITVTYTNLRSSEEDPDKQENDFKDLVELLNDDEFLLDSVDDGVYIKERLLYEEGGQLNGSYTGIFRRLKIDSDEIKSSENERTLTFDKDEGDVVISNGKVLESEDSFILTWPKEMRNLNFSITKKYDEPAFSLMEYYHEWTNN